MSLSATLHASPQDPANLTSTPLDEIRDRLQQPPARRLAPSEPVQLWPTFKSRVERHPYVLTLEQELHKQFDLNAFQRQSAEWSARCCGLDLGRVFSAIDKAVDERRVRKTREQIRRELAELDAARAAAGR